MITLELIIKGLISPRSVFQKILDLEVKISVVIEAALFIAVINTLFTYFSIYFFYSKNENDDKLIILYYQYILSKPIFLVFLELFRIFFITTLVTYLGKIFGGKGSFFILLKCVVWIHFVLVFLNIIVLSFIQIIPFLDSILVILANIWIMWVISECATKAHGFKSTFLVFSIGFIIFILLIIAFLQVFISTDINFIERVATDV